MMLWNNLLQLFMLLPWLTVWLSPPNRETAGEDNAVPRSAARNTPWGQRRPYHLAAPPGRSGRCMARPALQRLT